MRSGNGDLPLTRSGRAWRWLDELHLGDRHPVWLVDPDGISGRVRELLDAGHRRIAVGGGDGTLASLAALFVAHDAECVALPLGTHNHFARDLGIPLEPARWTDLLEAAGIREVDVGEANGRPFLNNLAVGLYPRMVRERARLDGERLLGSKRLASLWATIQVLRRRAGTISVSWRSDAGHGRFDTRALLIANNDYAGEPLAPLSRSRLDGGRLVLFHPRSLAPADLASMASFALAGRVSECPGLDVIHARQLELELPGRTLQVALDGELMRMASPIVIRHQARRLRVVVGAD